MAIRSHGLSIWVHDGTFCMCAPRTLIFASSTPGSTSDNFFYLGGTDVEYCKKLYEISLRNFKDILLMEVSHLIVEHLKFNYINLDHGFIETNSTREFCQLYTGKHI